MFSPECTEIERIFSVIESFSPVILLKVMCCSLCFPFTCSKYIWTNPVFTFCSFLNDGRIPVTSLLLSQTLKLSRLSLFYHCSACHPLPARHRLKFHNQRIVPSLIRLVGDPSGKEAGWETNIGDTKHVNQHINKHGRFARRFILSTK